MDISGFKRNCIFCTEIAMDFHLNVPVWETTHFVVLADVAPVRFGHLLILPRIHLRALSQLPEPLKLELGVIVRRLCEVMKPTFQHIALGEHGTIVEARSEGCMEHAHLHLCPTSLDPGAVEDELRRSARSMSEYTPLDVSGLQAEEYILWGSSVDAVGTWSPRGRGSQVVRKLLAQANELPSLPHWKFVIDRRRAIEAALMIRTALSLPLDAPDLC